MRFVSASWLRARRFLLRSPLGTPRLQLSEHACSLVAKSCQPSREMPAGMETAMMYRLWESMGRGVKEKIEVTIAVLVKESSKVRVGSFLPSVLLHSAMKEPEPVRHERASAFWLLASGFPLRYPRSVHGIRQSEGAFELVELCSCACHKCYVQGEERTADERCLERDLEVLKSSVLALVLQY